jgi:hypothetical protein
MKEPCSALTSRNFEDMAVLELPRVLETRMTALLIAIHNSIDTDCDNLARAVTEGSTRAVVLTQKTQNVMKVHNMLQMFNILDLLEQTLNHFRSHPGKVQRTGQRYGTMMCDTQPLRVERIEFGGFGHSPFLTCTSPSKFPE